MGMDVLSLALLVAFVGALGVALYLVFPSSDKLREMMETFNEKQEQSIETALKSKRSSNISSKLKRAGINMYPIVFRLIGVTTAAIVVFSVWKYTNNIVAGLVLSVIGYQIPFWILNMINTAYDKRMDVQVGILLSTTPQTILSSGSMEKTIENITRSIDNPLKDELNKVLGASRLGQSLEKGFAELSLKTGHDELRTYGKMVEISSSKGIDAAADSFNRLHKVVEIERSLARDKKADLAEYSMFIAAMIVGLPVAYILACTFSEVAYVSLTTWGVGKLGTIAIAVLVVGSYLGYKASTRQGTM